MKRRTLLLGAWSSALIRPASARTSREWPQGPITLIDPFAAGGATDYFSRVLADRLSPILGVPVVVENRAGAGGLIGAAAVAQARPDGQTLGLATVSTLCAGPAVHPSSSTRYDPLKDFAHVTKLVTLPSLLIANPKLPVRQFADLIALAKSKPGGVSIGVPGIGSAGHVLTEYFMKLAGIRLLVVPYKSGATMLTDLIAGQLDLISNNIPELLPHVRSGSARALAVRDTRRLPVLPDVPTYKELGLADVSDPLWFGLVAPAHTPRAVVDGVRAATHRAMVSSVFVDKTLAVSGSLSPTSSEEFAADAARLYERLREVVRAAGIKAA